MSLKKTQAAFQADEKARSRFLELSARAGLHALVDPAARPDAFPEEFHLRVRGKISVFPLLDPEFQLTAVQHWLSVQLEQSSSHPALISLGLFQLQKRLARLRSKNAKSLREMLGSIQEGLALPEIRSDLDEKQLQLAAFDSFAKLCQDHAAQSESMRQVEAELELYRNPGYQHEERRKEQKELEQDLARLRELLRKEREKSQELLEKLEQDFAGNSARLKEQLAQGLRALAGRCEQLTAQNMELLRRIDGLKKAGSLKSILDEIRARINLALRSESNELLLLKKLKDEISELERARRYLGQVYYDMGLLYLRNGDRSRARRELRAARELGVEDARTNRILEMQ